MLARVMIVSLAALSGLASAQDQKQDPVLKGPEVRDVAVPGEGRTLTGGGQRYGQGEVPHPVFVRAINSLRAEGVPVGLKLSSDQDAELRAAEEVHRKAIEAYMQKNRGEVEKQAAVLGIKIGEGRRGLEQFQREVREQFTKKKAPGQTGDDPMMSDEDREKASAKRAADRIRQIFEGAPKPGDTHVKMWAVLSEPQQKYAQEQLKKFQDEQAGRRGRPAGIAVDPAAKPDQSKPITDLKDPRVPERSRERLAKLPPEQQKKALERINQRLKEGPLDGGRKRQGGTDKPPPPMEDVNVPAPK